MELCLRGEAPACGTRRLPCPCPILRPSSTACISSTVQPFSFAEQRIPHVCMGLWAGGNDIVSSSVLTQACSMHGAGLEEGIAASS